MAKKKKASRKQRLYNLPTKHRSDADLFALGRRAGAAAMRFIVEKGNIYALVRNNWNLRGFILLCFFLAGMASLMDQVLWMRQLGLIFGTTMEAVSTVLAVFMAGLALGSYLFGKLADRSNQPLRLYAILQMGIGAYVMLTPLIFIGLNSIQVSIYASLPVGSANVTLYRILLSFLVLIVPTTLMGGTLPVIAKFFVRRDEELGGGVGNLYFINTLGAVLGAFLAGFLLIPYIGVLASTLLAASIDFAVGLVIFLLYRYRMKPAQEMKAVETITAEEVTPQAEPVPAAVSNKEQKRQQRQQERAGPREYSRAMRLVVFFGFAFGGLASLSLEVSWTRVLAMVLGSSVYAFSLMLIAFLLGIAVGSAIAAKFVDRSSRLWIYFLAVELLIGIAVVVLNPLLGQMPLLFVRVFPGLSANFWLLQFVLFLLLLVIMLVPTLLMGAAFPIATRIYTQDVKHLGGSVGRLYAGNTFGSMIGPLLTGFVIVPLIGIQWSVSIVAATYLLIAAAVLLVKVGPQVKTWGTKFITRQVWAAAAAAVIAIVFVVNMLIPVWGAWDKKIVTSGVFIYAKDYYSMPQGSLADRMRSNSHLLYYEEGLLATVAVYDTPDGNRTLRIDGKADASTYLDLGTELMLGHLPMLLHDNPEQALLVGLGSGITLGAVQQHPELVRVEGVEIEGAVIEAAELFDEANNNALDHPKLDMIQADAKNYVLAQLKKDKRYDVITAEPSNPWMAGNSNMFTREQFEMYKSVLDDDGIICQWIHYYSMGQDDLKTVIRTFTDVFPNTTLWRIADAGDLLMLATKDDRAIDFASLGSRIQQPDVAADLKRVDVDDIYDLLGMFVMGPDTLTGYCEGAKMHTDNHPVLQFSAPKHLYSETTVQTNIESLQQAAEAIEDTNSGDGDLLVNIDDADFADQIQAQRDFMEHFAEASVHGENGEQEEAIASYQAAIDTGANNALGYRMLGTYYLSLGQNQEAIDAWQEMLTLNQSNAWVWAALGGSYIDLGQYNLALDAYNNAAELVSDNAFFFLWLGILHQEMGNVTAAMENYNEAIRLHPATDSSWAYRAWFYLNLAFDTEDAEEKENYLDLASSDANASLARNSRQPLAYTVRGRTSYEKGLVASASAAKSLYSRAVSDYRRSISINPNLSYSHLYLGQALDALGGYDNLRAAYEAMLNAVQANSGYVEAYYEIGKLVQKFLRYDTTKNWTQSAIDHLSRVVEIDSDPDLTQAALTEVDGLFDWDNITEADRSNLESVTEKLPGTYVATKAQNAINNL